MRSAIVQTTLAVLMIGAICLIGSLPKAVGAPATQPATTTASAIKWDAASKHVGETATVTGPVMGTHVTGNGEALILNVGKDYPDPGRFSVMINIDPKHPASEAAYKGKTVTVTGKIELYRKVPEIKAKPSDVTVEESK